MPSWPACATGTLTRSLPGSPPHHRQPSLLARTHRIRPKEDVPPSEAVSSTFKTTLIRVFVVQFVALALLALLQLRYPG